jgi:hypothetical protein
MSTWAHYQYSSSAHYIGNSSILDPSSQISEATAGATQPRPVCYIILLIHSNKGWWQSFMALGPISVYLWPLYRKF